MHGHTLHNNLEGTFRSLLVAMLPEFPLYLGKVVPRLGGRFIMEKALFPRIRAINARMDQQCHVAGYILRRSIWINKVLPVSLFPAFHLHLLLDSVQVSCVLVLITSITTFEKSSYLVFLMFASFTIASPIAFEDAASLEIRATSTKYFFTL